MNKIYSLEVKHNDLKLLTELTCACIFRKMFIQTDINDVLIFYLEKKYC
jgi:hypothetical protein